MGCPGRIDFLTLFSCETEYAISSQALGIFYARVIQSNAACRALISKGHDNIHEVHVTYLFVGCHILMRRSFKIRCRNAFLRCFVNMGGPEPHSNYVTLSKQIDTYVPHHNA